MALVRKIHAEWKPSENNGLQVGDTIEVTDYRKLVEGGLAELIDDAGNVLPLPGTVFVCGVCYEKIDSLETYLDHVLAAHKIAKKIDMDTKDETPEQIPVAVDEPKQVITETWGQKMARLRAEKKARETKKSVL